MTRLCGGYRKGAAYLPQSSGIVNRETRPTPARSGRQFRGVFRASFLGSGRLPALRWPGYGLRMAMTPVREQLSGYRPVDAREAEFLSRMLVLGQTLEACERSHFSPGHFTASAFVLSPDRRDLVLIHHKKLGIWVQPGGHVEASDADLQSAARREVLEEVGLAELTPFASNASAVFDVDIHTIPARKADPAHEHFDVRFAFIANTRDLVHSEEVADLRWVPLADIEQMATDESVMRAVKKLRTLLG